MRARLVEREKKKKTFLLPREVSHESTSIHDTRLHLSSTIAALTQRVVLRVPGCALQGAHVARERKMKGRNSAFTTYPG